MDVPSCTAALTDLVSSPALMPWRHGLKLVVQDGDDTASPPAPSGAVVYLRCVEPGWAAGDAPAATQVREAAAVYTARGGQAYFWQEAAPSSKVVNGEGGVQVGRIHVVAPHVPTASALLPLLRHELTHAYDALVHGIDLTVSGLLACSEVRASGAGECSDMSWAWLRRRCVAAKATTSTGYMFGDDVASTCVHLVMPMCYDTSVGVDAAAAVKAMLPPAQPTTPTHPRPLT